MIGDIIKKARLEKNLSQSKLAEQAGVSKAYLFNLENNNQKNPSLDIAKRIANVLQLDPFLLLSGDIPYKNEDISENRNESLFALQKNIEELDSKHLEEFIKFIHFTLWKRERKEHR